MKRYRHERTSMEDAGIPKIRRVLLGLRIGLVCAIVVMLVLAWCLITGQAKFAQEQLQQMRIGIFICGILALVFVGASSRWGKVLELRAREFRAQVAEAGRRSDLRFSTAMEFSVVPQVLVDEEGFIVNANPAFAHLMSRSPSELVGAELKGLLLPIGEEALPEISRLDFQTDAQREYRQVERSGDLSRRTVRMITIAIPDVLDESFKSLVQFEDLTDLIKHHRILANDNRVLEERVAERTKALQLVNSELESFAYSVSHDLRGPLRAIDGFGQVLKHTAAAKLEPQELDYLERITGATQRMGALIDALLRMSRLSTAPLDAHPIDLSQLVAEVAQEVQAEYGDHRVAVEVQPGIRVRGDRVLIRNLFANLLSNSFKFTRDAAQPKVSIRSHPRNKFWAEVQVEDNGAGFDQRYVDKLFRPFQRLHRSDEFEGHGIGLASVKRIVDRHGGTIEAEGEPGKGARIRMTLPLALLSAGA